MSAALLPLFAIILLGAVAARTGYVPAQTIAPISAFVVRIALPALIFGAVTSAPLGEAINPGFLSGYAAASLAVLTAGIAAGRLVFGLPVAQAAVLGLGMANSNSGFMGYPIALTLIGGAAAPMLAQCMIVENILIIPLAMILIDTGGRGAGAGRVMAILAVALRSPIIVAVVAGLVVSASGLGLPSAVADAVAMLSRIAAPIALFVVGATVATAPLGGMAGPLAAVAAGKLVLHPIAVFAALSLMPGVDPTTLAGGVVFAAVPMLSIFPLLAQRAGMGVVAASALLATTLLSFATLSVAVLPMIAPLLGR
ncbi:MAG: AEC family transporter [Rhodobacteraceae bacterium]|nr:AEC family transporter [Paracoccaceae bacterium]